MHQILTKWHIAEEALNANRVCFLAGQLTKDKKHSTVHFKDEPDCVNKESYASLMDSLESAPKFLLDAEVADTVLSQQKEVMSTLGALSECGLLHLPYDTQVVEILSAGAPYRRFVLLVEINESWAEYRSTIEELKKQGLAERDYTFVCMCFDLVEKGVPQPYVVFNVNQVLFTYDRTGNATDEVGVYYSVVCSVFNAKEKAVIRQASAQTRDEVTRVAGSCAASLILLMKSKGVDREVLPAPEKLNKARARQHRPLIPSATLLRIGHVFNDSKGEQRTSRGGHAGCGGDKRAKLHLVRGHAHTYWTGKGRTVEKKLFVESYFKGLREDGRMPNAITPPVAHIKL